jgi:hypothetical protein
VTLNIANGVWLAAVLMPAPARHRQACCGYREDNDLGALTRVRLLLTISNGRHAPPRRRKCRSFIEAKNWRSGIC